MNAAHTTTASRRSIRCARALLVLSLLCGATNGFCGQAPQPKRTPPKPSTPVPAPDPTPPANPQQAQLDAQILEQQKQQQQYQALLAQQQADDARKKKLKERPTVKWQYSIEEAQQLAASDEKPFAVYFCSAGTAALAGEGQEAFDKYRAGSDNDDVPPPTIFDTPVVPAALKKAGIAHLVKVAYTAENKPLFKQYDAQLNTIVLLAPTGDLLIDFGGTDCTVETVSKFLNEEFRLKYEEWWGKRQRQLNLQR